MIAIKEKHNRQNSVFHPVFCHTLVFNIHDHEGEEKGKVKVGPLDDKDMEIIDHNYLDSF